MQTAREIYQAKTSLSHVGAFLSQRLYSDLVAATPHYLLDCLFSSCQGDFKGTEGKKLLDKKSTETFSASSLKVMRNAFIASRTFDSF